MAAARTEPAPRLIAAVPYSASTQLRRNTYQLLMVEPQFLPVAEESRGRLNWDDCQAFIKKMNEKYGKPRRRFALPTEWGIRLPARRGTATRTARLSILDAYSWYATNSKNNKAPGGRKEGQRMGGCTTRWATRGSGAPTRMRAAWGRKGGSQATSTDHPYVPAAAVIPRAAGTCWRARLAAPPSPSQLASGRPPPRLPERLRSLPLCRSRLGRVGPTSLQAITVHVPCRTLVPAVLYRPGPSCRPFGQSPSAAAPCSGAPGGDLFRFVRVRLQIVQFERGGWGGPPPATQLLRHRETASNVHRGSCVWW